MKKQEFMVKQATIRKREAGRMAGLLFMVAGMVVMAHFISRFNQQHSGRVASDWIPTVGFCLLLLMIIAWLVSGVQRIRRERLACPHCGKFATRPWQARSTANCGYCGEKLFEETVQN